MSELPRIYADGCDCPPGQCAAMWGDDDRGECVNRLQGEVCVIRCERCGAGTWHQDGECTPCRKRCPDA